MADTDCRERLVLGPLVSLETCYALSCLTYSFTREIYLARDILLGWDVAIKFELAGGQQHTLEHEFHIYQNLGGAPGIPCVHWFGVEVGFNVLVIDRLGLSLEDLFVIFHFQFSVKTDILLALQLVSECEFFAFIH